MSVRVDTASLIAGACVCGNRGQGVLGAVIRATTATGTHGSGFLYNDLTGADDLKEIRGLIVTPPSAGAFVAQEDGSFSLTGAPDGSYSFTYRLFADGADLGTATGSITIGAAGVAVTASVIGTITGAVAAAVDVSDPAPGTVTVTAAATGIITGTVSAHAAVTTPGTTAHVTAAVVGTITGTLAAQVAVTTDVWRLIPQRRSLATAAHLAAWLASTRLRLVTDALVEPLSLDDAKLHLRVTGNAEDSLIAAFIQAARRQTEHELNRALITQVWELTADEFPAGEIPLCKAQVQDIVSVKYLDQAGFEQTLSLSDFALDAQGTTGWLFPATAWPGTYAGSSCVRVRFTAGYGSAASDVPANVVAYIKLLVGALYRNRETFAAGQNVAELPGRFAGALLDSEKVYL